MKFNLVIASFSKYLLGTYNVLNPLPGTENSVLDKNSLCSHGAYILLEKTDNNKTAIYVKGNSLAVQWLGLHTSIAGGQGSILVRELRSHKPCGTTKKEKI